jgi:hypothetical protein
MVRGTEISKTLVGASDEEPRVQAKQIQFFPDPDIVSPQSFIASATSSRSVLLVNAQDLLPLWRAAAEKWVEECF